MPAYRSQAEGEIRTAVVARLRGMRPEARIMHEVNASSFGNRIDVLAVSRAEIIAIEIKSAKDKLDRLPDQLAAMRGCAHRSLAAIHEKFLIERPTHAENAHYERQGAFFYGAIPEGCPWSETWVYPERKRSLGDKWRDHLATWEEPRLAVSKPLPAGALDMLWRDELLDMCGRFSVCVPKRPTMSQMIPALRWQLSGRDLTLGICAALRARPCIEADPAIAWKQAA